MSIFDPKSRYAAAPLYQVVDHRKRRVNVVSVPPPPNAPLDGWHLWREGQRPDHLAFQYLDDAAGFWRIAEANDAMQAEWLSEQPRIAIPVKSATAR
jgi:hypothetical protein